MKCGSFRRRKEGKKLQVAWVRLGGEFWVVLGAIQPLVRCGRERRKV